MAWRGRAFSAQTNLGALDGERGGRVTEENVTANAVDVVGARGRGIHRVLSHKQRVEGRMREDMRTVHFIGLTGCASKNNPTSVRALPGIVDTECRASSADS